MWELFLHPSNIIFSISLCLMLLFGIFEICMTLLGGGSQGFLDQFLPDNIGHQAEINFDSDYSYISKVFDWLYLGKVPLFVWLIIFLTTYGLSGFFVQGIIFNLTQTMLSGWIAAPICLFLCMPFVRWGSKIVTKILPQDETTAIHSDDLIGLTGIIILGEARQYYPAQAKVRDIHGLTHYVLVEPEIDEIFIEGQTIILTNRTKVGYQAQASTHTTT
jgi:hypothetical protein